MLDFEYSKKVNFGFFEFGIYQFKSHQSSILVCAPIIKVIMGFGDKTMFVFVISETKYSKIRHLKAKTLIICPVRDH